MEEIIEIWKKENVDHIRFEFSCGGDSMNDTQFYIVKKDETESQSSDLLSFFEDEIYKQVEFYEVSDGHYMGESGTVIITLDDDENDFSYSKSSQSEYEETYTNDITIEVTPEQFDYLKNYVSDLNGGNVDLFFNYSKDFIKTDRFEELETELKEMVINSVNEFDLDVEGEILDEYTIETEDEWLEDNKVTFVLHQRVFEVREN